MNPVNLTQKFSLFPDHWRPKVVARLNGQEVKLIKAKGVFPWHKHDQEDEMFLVWRGVFQIEFRNRLVTLNQGELLVVPAGVEHRTMASEEAEALCFEPAGVRNTGNMVDPDFTAAGYRGLEAPPRGPARPHALATGHSTVCKKLWNFGPAVQSKQVGGAVKYWAYFAAKLAVVAVFLRAVWDLMNWLIPEPETFLHYHVSRYPQDLRWTSAIFGLFLLGVGLTYLVVWDQRARCRTCLRHLRMPLTKGSWSKAILLNPPELESICPYGHGTLTESEVHITGRKPAEWTPHDDDMWKELESIDRKS